MPDLVGAAVCLLACSPKGRAPFFDALDLCLADDSFGGEFFVIPHDVRDGRCSEWPEDEVQVIGHDDIAQELEFALVAVEVEAVVQGDDEAGSGKDGQAVVHHRGDVIDVAFNVKSRQSHGYQAAE